MPATGNPTHRPKKWLAMSILLGCAVFLFLQAFILPGVPRVVTGDEGIYLSLAARMMDGQLIYRDYDHFSFPGTITLYWALFKLFGVRAWIAPVMLILMGVSFAWLSTAISAKLMSGPIVFLPGLLFLSLPYTGFFEATHHWYGVLAATAALFVVTGNTNKERLLWAGVLWGIAIWFTQSLALGALGLVVFLAWQRHRKRESLRLLLRKEAYFLGSLAVTVLALNIYFVWKVTLRTFLYHTVVFLDRYYSADWFNQPSTYMTHPPSFRSWFLWPNLAAFLLTHLLLPLIYVLFFVRYYRESRLHLEEPWDALMMVNLIGLFLFLSVAHAPAYQRLYTVSLPALILLAWFLKADFKTERFLRAACWAAVLVAAIVRPAITQGRWKGFLDLPTGRTAFTGDRVLYEKCQWVSQRTKPGDYFLDDPHVCFALRLRDPSRVPFLRPTDYTRPEEVEGAIEALGKHRVRFVGWYTGSDTEIADPAGDHLGPLRDYLRAHYHVAKRFSNGDAIWELNP